MKNSSIIEELLLDKSRSFQKIPKPLSKQFLHLSVVSFCFVTTLSSYSSTNSVQNEIWATDSDAILALGLQLTNDRIYKQRLGNNGNSGTRKLEGSRKLGVWKISSNNCSCEYLNIYDHNVIVASLYIKNRTANMNPPTCCSTGSNNSLGNHY